MWLDRAISWIFPTITFQGAAWYPLWEAKERDGFLKLARILYPLVGAAYIAHYIFFDRVMHLEPIEFWFRFRISMAAIAWLTSAYYLSPSLYRRRYYKLPAMIAGTAFCYFQARVLVWYEDTLYFYAFGFVIVATVVLRLSVAQSLLYAGLLIGSQWTSYKEAGIETPLLFSATAISLIFVVFARSGYSAEIKYFHANQQNIANQKKIIELNIEFADRIRAFLPREISRRLFHYVEDRKMTILQAIEEVLRPRRRDIACMFSDIRGFTKSTRGLGDVYLDEGVIPNVKECTLAIERNGGIPRKIGDLLFAYFDQSSTQANLIRCFKAALDVVQANNDFNNKRVGHDPIIRYVLIASGEAIVGNLGGFDSSIEITALGNPVNLLARIDEATKAPALRELITNNHIVMDNRTADGLSAIVPEFRPQRVDLVQLGVCIRDFENVEYIWVYKAEPQNNRSTAAHLDVLVRSHVEDVRDSGGQIQSVRS
jgi:class 3 adenylate cyclase